MFGTPAFGRTRQFRLVRFVLWLLVPGIATPGNFRARARSAVRRDSLTEEQACALLLHHGSALTRVALRIFRKMSWTCPNCSVMCGPGRRKCTTRDCRTPKPKSLQDVESAGLWACSECSYSRNFVGREACYKCGARKRVERSPSPRRRDRKSQESRGHGHRPRSFVEVLKAEASKFVPAMTAASTTVQDSSAEMDTSAQQGEIKQRLNELDKIISKLEDVGTPALADLDAAQKAEKETLRGRLQEYKPTSQRLKLAQDARDKAARKHRQVGESWRRCGCFWTRQHRLGGRGRWHSSWLSKKRIRGLPDCGESKSRSARLRCRCMGCALVRRSFGRQVPQLCRQRLPSSFSHGLARSHRM